MTAAITPTERVDLSPTELDLLATYAGRPFPFPLRVPSTGRIAGERAALFAAAGQRLAERGLATPDGPVGIAAELMTALREHRNTVDLVVIDGTQVTGAVTMILDSHAVVCRQSIGPEPAPVTVTRVADTALTTELTAFLPRVKAAPTLPLTLPPGVLEDALRLLRNTMGITAPRERVRALVRERGGEASAVDALIDLVPSVSGRGQLGVVLRSPTGAADRPPELSWLDTPRGRVRVDRDPRGWVSVNPLRHGELLTALNDAVARARA